MFEAKSRMFFVYILRLIWFTINGNGRNQITLRKISGLLHKIYSSSESSKSIAPVLGLSELKMYLWGTGILAYGKDPQPAAEQGYHSGRSVLVL